MSKEGTYLIEIERHYVATIEVDADSERQAIRYAHSDENQHIANRNEDYFHNFQEIEHEAKVVRFKSYEEQYPEDEEV
tara:strand:+ start:899 stop:1132 length:234 start_codon:yes stop_codon:yes gene_type:complete